MPITYYPTSANAALPTGSWPLAYPGKPISHGIGCGLTLPDLVFASILDIMEGAPLPTPINVSWLFDVFESVLDESHSRFRVRQYSSISRSWKKALSETVANSVSLGIALFEEGFDWAVPVPLVKDIDSLPHWWPWAPNRFFAKPLNVTSPATSRLLMPDFLLGQTVGGITAFSSMEAKGRDDPLDTPNFSVFEEFKRQAENIQLQDEAGLVVPLHRKILSVVAVRPTLVVPANRELKCRWFNHAEPPFDAPPGFLTQMALTQAKLLIWRLFGRDLWRYLGRLDKDGRWPKNTSEELIAKFSLKAVEGGIVRTGSEQDPCPWRPFISCDTLALLKELQYMPLRPKERRSTLIEMDRSIVQFLSNRLPANRKGSDGTVVDPMLRIGIGLKAKFGE